LATLTTQRLFMVAQLRTAETRLFLIIWFGQFVSILGSALTRFALGVWVFQETGSTTNFALINVFIVLPAIFLSPLAGSLVDRYNRRTVMMAADIVAGFSTLLIVVLLFGNQLAIWHIYLATILNAAADVFQVPAYGAVTAQLVPKELLPRANGLVSLAESVSQIAAPVMGGFLIIVFGLWRVLAIDFLTFLFAIGTLMLIRVPDVIPDAKDTVEERSLRSDMISGWKFIRTRQALFALLIFNIVINIIAVSEMMVTPLVLSFSTEDALGWVLGIGGIGYLVGSLFMSGWGGPKRLIIGVVVFEAFIGLSTFTMGLRPSVVLIAAAVFLQSFMYPIMRGCNLTLWQRKVPNALQGRVIATRRMLIRVLLPVVFILAGQLIDNVFQPMMQPEGLLADSLGSLVGVGEGRGIALLMLITGSIHILTVIVALTYAPLRQIERDLPDGDSAVNRPL
jgi:MFS transporter, DHA3 family, macrolide efflux protein